MSSHEVIYYIRGRSIQAIRVGDWKYRYAADKPDKGAKKAGKQRGQQQRSEKKTFAALYNLRDDIGEQKNLIEEQPEIAARLKKKLEAFSTAFRKSQRAPGIAE